MTIDLVWRHLSAARCGHRGGARAQLGPARHHCDCPGGDATRSIAHSTCFRAVVARVGATALLAVRGRLAGNVLWDCDNQHATATYAPDVSRQSQRGFPIPDHAGLVRWNSAQWFAYPVFLSTPVAAVWQPVVTRGTPRIRDTPLAKALIFTQIFHSAWYAKMEQA